MCRNIVSNLHTAIKVLATKSVDVTPLISKVFPIEEGIEAFQYAARKGGLKVLVEIA